MPHALVPTVRRTLQILAAVALACPLAALAHGGAMDGCGCHADRQAGGYHCHRGQFANKNFRDKQELLALLAPAATCTPPKSENPAAAPILPSAPDIPDHTRTPGAINKDITQDNIQTTVCVAGWTKTIRPSASYTEELKKRQMRELGLPGTARDYHEDHLVPLCVGGAPRDARNLWPQPLKGKWTDKRKDLLEASVCRQVCKGDITLQAGQAIFLDETDWTKAYEKYFRRSE